MRFGKEAEQSFWRPLKASWISMGVKARARERGLKILFKLLSALFLGLKSQRLSYFVVAIFTPASVSPL